MENIENILYQILNNQKDMKEDIEIKTDFSGLKSDVSNMKTNISSIKADLSELKTDVSNMKIDIANLKTDMSTVKTTLTAVVNHTADLTEFKAQTKKDLSEIKILLNLFLKSKLRMKVKYSN